MLSFDGFVIVGWYWFRNSPHLSTYPSVQLKL